MNAQTELNRLARLSLINELTAALEVEERIARHRRRSIDWRKVLTTKTISEEATVFGKEQ